MKPGYLDPRARQISHYAELVDLGAAPTPDLIEACRDLSAAMARWARRNKAAKPTQPS